MVFRRCMDLQPVAGVAANVLSYHLRGSVAPWVMGRQVAKATSAIRGAMRVQADRRASLSRLMSGVPEEPSGVW